MTDEDTLLIWICGISGFVVGMVTTLIMSVATGDVTSYRDDYMKSQGYVWNYEHKIYTPIPKLEGVKPNLPHREGSQK